MRKKVFIMLAAIFVFSLVMSIMSAVEYENRYITFDHPADGEIYDEFPSNIVIKTNLRKIRLRLYFPLDIKTSDIDELYIDFPTDGTYYVPDENGELRCDLGPIKLKSGTEPYRIKAYSGGCSRDVRFSIRGEMHSYSE